jgi:hypothetical protein
MEARNHQVLDELAVTRARLAKAQELFFCDIGQKEPRLLLDFFDTAHALCNQLVTMLSDKDKAVLSSSCCQLRLALWGRVPIPLSAGQPVFFGRTYSFTVTIPSLRQIEKTFSILPRFSIVGLDFKSDKPFPVVKYIYKSEPLENRLVFTFPAIQLAPAGDLTEECIKRLERNLRDWINLLHNRCTQLALRLQFYATVIEVQQL